MANQPIDQTMLNAVVAAVMQQLQGQGPVSPDEAPKAKGGWGGNTFDFVRKDKALLSAFTRKGYTNVVLGVRDANGKIDNTNATVRPYRVWTELGRRVRKGETGTKGLFHISQTDPIAPKAPAPEPRKLFKGKAKPKLTPVS